MRMLLSSLFFFGIVSSGLLAHGQTTRLQDASYLRKLSFHIRGLAPTSAEYAALKKAQVNGKQAEFMDQKIEEYLATEQHARKLTFRLQELFRLKTMEHPVPMPSNPTDPMIQVPYFERNALDDLFKSLAKKNLSWDTLLTGKSYQLYPKTINDFMILSDLAFMRALAPNVLPGLGQNKASNPNELVPVPLAFQPDDPRIAGALTTARFFNRYTTTELNKNRRRAAAVFNVFLCDPMELRFHLRRVIRVEFSIELFLKLRRSRKLISRL